ncbi:hypothetical protein [Candidatus Contubernalis alkaliaceticus]|uniref:hypothetical protein n=1 Tax=Candidatus Contubernalis alkaliaceticus TaxID=338645 RepID=UPI001F4C121A|nr:hypothetical protein [Candidatus Contubernalis alkalaceticus]UNC93267.1 hypothetical protein HUE98_14930 [Candidatus Contubernalis alkalaceticus]
MIVPAYSEVDFEKYPDFAKITLLQQANGEIITPPDLYIDLQSLVNDLSNKYNTIRFYVYQADKTGISTTMELSEEAVAQILRIALTLIMFTVVGLSTNILGRVRENYYRYGVHLMSGGTLTGIACQMAGLVLYIIGYALCISLLISAITLGIGMHLIVTLLVALVVFGLSCIAPTIAITRLNVNQLIRRKE